MSDPIYKTGDVVRYIGSMASVFGSEPKIILKSSIIEDSTITTAVMYDLLDGDRKVKMWERWLVLV